MDQYLHLELYFCCHNGFSTGNCVHIDDIIKEINKNYLLIIISNFPIIKEYNRTMCNKIIDRLKENYNDLGQEKSTQYFINTNHNHKMYKSLTYKNQKGKITNIDYKFFNDDTATTNIMSIDDITLNSGKPCIIAYNKNISIDIIEALHPKFNFRLMVTENMTCTICYYDLIFKFYIVTSKNNNKTKAAVPFRKLINNNDNSNGN